MPSLQIDNPKIVKLANELAKATGETLEDAVLHSLERRLQEFRSPDFDQKLFEDLMGLTEPPLPVFDTRAEAEILGYNERGLF
jgi:hypothetical protein